MVNTNRTVTYRGQPVRPEQLRRYGNDFGYYIINIPTWIYSSRWRAFETARRRRNITVRVAVRFRVVRFNIVLKITVAVYGRQSGKKCVCGKRANAAAGNRVCGNREYYHCS